MNSQPKPEPKKYTELISEIKKGHIKIPKFQRDLVCSLDKIAKLLDSILKGYQLMLLFYGKQAKNLIILKSI